MPLHAPPRHPNILNYALFRPKQSATSPRTSHRSPTDAPRAPGVHLGGVGGLDVRLCVRARANAGLKWLFSAISRARGTQRGEKNALGCQSTPELGRVGAGGPH